MSGSAEPSGKPIWPKIAPGFVRAVLAGHSALGLAFAALIYLVCFSGTVAVFAREFQRWEEPAAPMLSAVTPRALQTAATQAVAGAAEVEHLFINLPTPQLPRLTLIVDDHGKQTTWIADGAGRLVRRSEASWTEFMTALHINLHLPRTWGIFVVGLTGVALLSSLISGLLAHPRVFKDAFHLRWGGSKRLQEADLHNRLGVWALPFHLIVSTTGALLGLTTIIVGVLALAVFQGDVNKAYALFLPPEPKEDPRPGPMPDIPAMLATVQRLSPGARPTYVGLEHPKERGQGAFIFADQPSRVAASDSFAFGPGGVVLKSQTAADRNLGLNILNALGPLHFGWFGGGAVKIAYGLLGLALTAVTASGVAIWLARRRDKGRPAPRWERVWIAAVWSQPVAFAGSALVSLGVKSEGVLLLAWAAFTLACAAAALVWAPAALSRVLRLTACGLLVLVALAWTILKGASVTDPMGWIVTASLVALGAGLAATVVLRKAAS